jgi:general secretion pathway protein K
MGARGRRGERGVALLLALLTMVLMTVVVIEFTTSSQVEYRRSAMWVAGRRAAAVADSGVMLAGEVLHADFQLGMTDSFQDIWARELPPIETGAGLLTVRIEDEQGKINLNNLGAGTRTRVRDQIESLFDKLGLDRTLVSPLADWIDSNHEPESGPLGAEDAWYASVKPPYAPRNGPLRSYAELALVRGFTPAILTKLRHFVSVLPETTTKVNVNTASAEVLRSIDPKMDDESLVEKLIAARTAVPFTSSDGLRTTGGLEAIPKADLDRLFSFSSDWFRVRSTGAAGDAMRSSEALLHRDNGVSTIVYLLPRRGPNIVGVDGSAPTGITDAALAGQGPGGSQNLTGQGPGLR